MIDFSDSRPNVLLFICDDLAWGDLACHGNPHVRTPNLDRLHTDSARLEHYCSGPLCSPARASLLTGRYHLRTRVIDTYSGRSIIDPAERTIAHDLSAAGYRCGAFGKWHLGDCFPSRAIDMGFEETVMHGAGGIGQPGDHPRNYDRWHADSYFDPSEQQNLAGTESERSAKMRADYDAWLLDMAGTRGTETFDCQPIHIGSERETTTLLTTNDWRLITGDSWNQTDLRGYWRIKNLKSGNYSLRILFEHTPTSGPIQLSIDDTQVTADAVDAESWAKFPRQRLSKGYLQLEGWVESATHDSALNLQRFESAFYIELRQHT